MILQVVGFFNYLFTPLIQDLHKFCRKPTYKERQRGEPDTDTENPYTEKTRAHWKLRVNQSSNPKKGPIPKEGSISKTDRSILKITRIKATARRSQL